jgi:antirestriction protein ArdC
MENFNSVTNAFYSEQNQKHLEEHKESLNLKSNEWAGFKQWKEKGRKVNGKGTGCKIFIICEKKTGEKDEQGEDVKIKVPKALYVFNLESTLKI